MYKSTLIFILIELTELSDTGSVTIHIGESRINAEKFARTGTFV
jgi:hypothetical protein